MVQRAKGRENKLCTLELRGLKKGLKAEWKIVFSQIP